MRIIEILARSNRKVARASLKKLPWYGQISVLTCSILPVPLTSYTGLATLSILNLFPLWVGRFFHGNMHR